MDGATQTKVGYFNSGLWASWAWCQNSGQVRLSHPSPSGVQARRVTVSSSCSSQGGSQDQERSGQTLQAHLKPLQASQTKEGHMAKCKCKTWGKLLGPLLCILQGHRTRDWRSKKNNLLQPVWTERCEYMEPLQVCWKRDKSQIVWGFMSMITILNFILIVMPNREVSSRELVWFGIFFQISRF